jgi:hypothetical protein
MGKFLREYWLWIAMPIVLVVTAVLLVVFLSGDNDPAPFVYNVF